MSESLSSPKIKISPEKNKIYYEKILSEASLNNNNNINFIKSQNDKKNKINSNIDNKKTTEAICNIIDLINDNNLNLIYKDDTNNFKRNIDQLNLKFYLETEKIMSSNPNSSKEENYLFNSNKLFLILFKQINLYVKEIERLNSIIINSAKTTDTMKKRIEIFLRKQKDFETKEKIIQTLKNSVSSLEKKLSNVLLSENNLRQEIQKLQKEKNFYYEYYKSYISTLSNNNNSTNITSNRSQKIHNLKRNGNKNELLLTQKNNTNDYFFRNSKDIIIFNDTNSSINSVTSINEHKKNNSENEYIWKIINNNNNSGRLKTYCNANPKIVKAKDPLKANNYNIKTGNKSIIRLCNFHSNNNKFSLQIGCKSRSPVKNNKSPNKKNISSVKERKNEKGYFHKSMINDNKFELNILNSKYKTNNTFTFDNPFVNKTIYNASKKNLNTNINVNKLNKNKNRIEKSNENIKKFSHILSKESKSQELDIDVCNLNMLESLLIEIKDYLINNNKNKNKNVNNKKYYNDVKYNPNQKSIFIYYHNNGNKFNNSNNIK